MLKKIKFDKWLIEVNVDQTSDYYKRDLEVCDCLDCTNFIKACMFMTPPVSEFFYSLGIDPQKPAHLSRFPGEGSMHQYIGNYHFIGRVLEGELCTNLNWIDKNTISIENFILGLSKELVFVPEDFPKPIVQLDFEVVIPWVIIEDD
ncbi:hypothetical protein [Neobacillus sp. DY30]|uniref:hypothetical protein n=1 Tax=Neobacillus sp. DY30 TaxID=3047871 RepID=UPI0024C02C39|nr:hypothetical protein [Neobacillus sp. DY30]WHX98415.1 hypothetical protein QNH29_17340 [Neobacillus sp. DY30]